MAWLKSLYAEGLSRKFRGILKFLQDAQGMGWLTKCMSDSGSRTGAFCLTPACCVKGVSVIYLFYILTV